MATKKQVELLKLVETYKVESIHENDNLVFEAIDVWTIRKATPAKVSIHTSKYYSAGKTKKGSEYFFAEVRGKLAYVRISNHWGTFFTGIGESTKRHEWTLKGGVESSSRVQAGVIYL